MKLVIDIDEKIYYRAMLGDFNITVFNEAVRNGIPLPKGHGRLIDENDLWFDDIDNISCVTQRDVENAPTIIEADKGE